MIFKASPHHAAALAEIEAQQPLAAGWKKQGFESELAQACAHIYCACKNEQLTGFLALRSAGGFAEILNVAVGVCFARQGVATALLTHALLRLKEQQVQRVTLEVFQSNTPALALYQKAGFTVLAERKDFYGQGKNAFIMGRDL